MDLLDMIVDRIAEATAEKLSGISGWVDQRDSHLGRNRHIAAVRRRLEKGLPGAGRVGGRWLLSPEALREEAGAAPLPLRKTSPEDAFAASLERQLKGVR